MLTLTLHKSLPSIISDMLERLACSGQVLDARYLMLDIQECTWKAIQKHPVSSLPDRSSERVKTGNQYPGSINIANGFRLNSLSPIQYIMQLSGISFLS
jgi:hypothetical protein